MLYVGYRIVKDRQSLLSYSWDGNVMTIDPVSTANPGWTTFLAGYNQFCSDHGGIPLLNQTPRSRARKWRESLGRPVAGSSRRRARASTPSNRLLNDYFRDLLGQ